MHLNWAYYENTSKGFQCTCTKATLSLFQNSSDGLSWTKTLDRGRLSPIYNQALWLQLEFIVTFEPGIRGVCIVITPLLWSRWRVPESFEWRKVKSQAGNVRKGSLQNCTEWSMMKPRNNKRVSGTLLFAIQNRYLNFMFCPAIASKRIWGISCFGGVQPMKLPLSVERGQFINIKVFRTNHILHQSTDLSHRLQVTSHHHPVHQQVNRHILEWPGRRMMGRFGRGFQPVLRCPNLVVVGQILKTNCRIRIMWWSVWIFAEQSKMIDVCVHLVTNM